MATASITATSRSAPFGVSSHARRTDASSFAHATRSLACLAVGLVGGSPYGSRPSTLQIRKTLPLTVRNWPSRMREVWPGSTLARVASWLFDRANLLRGGRGEERAGWVVVQMHRP